MGERAQLRIVAVGHVDHGKSTLIGRLLHDSNNLPDGKVAELQAASACRGVPFEWSFVLDALQAERDQAITIDTTRIWMRLDGRDVVMIDAPGHVEFLRNMVTGASDADAALLVVDAVDGVGEQSRRHVLLLELIGVRHVVVAVNKMDRVEYARERYDAIVAELDVILDRIGIAARTFVPIAARDGDNVVHPSQAMRWYAGPTLAATLHALEPIRRHDGTELRLAVQGVLRRDEERIVVGRIESGTIAVGREVVFSPGERRARVTAFAAWPDAPATAAAAGESVGFTLDAPIFIERGDVVSDASGVPDAVHAFRARLLWLGGTPLDAGDVLSLRIGTMVAPVEVVAFERVVDITTLGERYAARAVRNDVVEVVLRSRRPLAIDTVARHPALGRFILIRDLDVVAGGTVLEIIPDRPATNLVNARHGVDRRARGQRNGHRGAVIWLTGLPASGKSTIAMELEARLFAQGIGTYVLDGDNLRRGLCSDLGFTRADRGENVRRVGEVATLLADAGIVAIAALISPYRAERAAVRRAACDAYHEIYVRADATVCEARDPKGHYARARAGAIANFTGITGDYEPPETPELVLDTDVLSVDEAVDALARYVTSNVMWRTLAR